MLSDQSNRYRQGVTASILVLAVFLGLLGINTRLVAAPISREQALEAAYAWLSLSPQAMHQRHGQLAGTVTPVWDTTGQAEFYAVDLKPKGFVIVAADDAVEPIIAFSSTEVFQAVPGHPLFEMLRGDLPGRLARARSGVAAPPPLAGKWQMLRRVANAPKILTATAASMTSGYRHL